MAKSDGKKPKFSQKDLALFADYYVTNEHCFAEQLPPNENGKARWNKVEGPDVSCTSAIEEHLAGDRTIGAYTIIHNEPFKDCCKNCTFDFDMDMFTRQRVESLPEEEREAAFERELTKIENQVKGFLVILAGLGVKSDNLLVSFSGYKGYHVDLFFQEPVPASIVYLFANALKRYAKLPDTLEVFPKQLSAGNAYGSLVKLPLGVHKLTGKRGIFVDMFGTDDMSFGTPFDHIRKTIKLTLSDVTRIREAVSSEEISEGVCDNIRELVDLTKPPTCASLSKMLSSCNALKRLIQKAKKDHHLLHEERLALLILCIHFGETGREKLHEIMSNCSDYSKEETEKMIVHAKEKKKYKPIKCTKLQNMHICTKNCSEILEREGKSPIKLAYSKSKVDIKLSQVEEVESVQCHEKSISVPFKVDSLLGGSYTIPKEVIFTCSDICPARISEKVRCEHTRKSGETKFQVTKDGLDMLECPDSSSKSIKRKLYIYAKIPCVKPDFLSMRVKSNHKVQKVMISTADEVMRMNVITNAATLETKAYVAFFNGDNINISTDYIGYGRVHPHPENQKTTFVFSKVERMMGSLDNFHPTETQLSHLKTYKSLNKKWLLNQLSSKLSGVHGRERETLVVMMTIMSPLQLTFNNRRLKRGWLETCFIGDSAQGKSLLPEEILTYLGLCNKVTGGNTSVAGMIGGVGKHDTSMYISWGVLPNSDKTIIFIDELGQLQAKQDVMQALREIRSTGQANITKIRKGSKPCRVRLIASANPKKGATMDSFRRGCQALPSILELPDIRRFDIFQLFFQGEIPPEVIMQENDGEQIEVDSELLRTVVQWAWTRDESDLKFTPEVTRAILDRCMTLTTKYGPASVTIPLVANDVYESFARQVMACAMYHMRTDDDFQRVIPIMDDVDIVYNILESTYSSPRFALDEEAKDCLRRTEVPPDWMDKFAVVCRSNGISETLNLHELINNINNLQKIRAEELAIMMRAPRADISKVLMLLAVENMLTSESGGNYRASSKMYRLCRKLSESNAVMANVKIATLSTKESEDENLDELFE